MRRWLQQRYSYDADSTRSSGILRHGTGISRISGSVRFLQSLSDASTPSYCLPCESICNVAAVGISSCSCSCLVLTLSNSTRVCYTLSTDMENTPTSSSVAGRPASNAARSCLTCAKAKAKCVRQSGQQICERCDRVLLR